MHCGNMRVLFTQDTTQVSAAQLSHAPSPFPMCNEREITVQKVDARHTQRVFALTSKVDAARAQRSLCLVR
eukprot:4726453-Prymnesium_polylepis.1